MFLRSGVDQQLVRVLLAWFSAICKLSPVYVTSSTYPFACWPTRLSHPPSSVLIPEGVRVAA